jgi:hypothetical protein
VNYFRRQGGQSEGKLIVKDGGPFSEGTLIVENISSAARRGLAAYPDARWTHLRGDRPTRRVSGAPGFFVGRR